MTLRQKLAQLALGQSCTFASIDQAISAGSSAAKFYDGRRFKRAGLTITRIA